MIKEAAVPPERPFLKETIMSTASAECVLKRTGGYFDGLAVSGQHRKIFFIIMLAYFFEQMDNINFGYVAMAMFSTWGLGPQEANHAMGLILTFYFIGMTLGGFLGGVISDLIGRRKTFLGSIVVFSVTSIITGLPIDNVYVFATIRAMTGFGVFCMMVCSQVYIAEMAPAESRGKWQGLIGAVGFCAVPAVGLLCAAVVPMAPEAWRFIFFFGGLGMVGFFLGVRHLKESPRWLVNRNRKEEAEEVIRGITGVEVDLSQESGKAECRQSVLSILGGMFTGRYRGRTLLLLALFCCVTPATFIFTTWTAKLLAGMQALDPATGEAVSAFSQRTALTIMSAITCGTPFGCFVASRIAEMGGRKLPLCGSFLVAGLAALGFAYAPPSAPLLWALGFTICAALMSGNMIMFTYASESFPTRMRNTANGTLNGAGRLAVSACQSLIPILLLAFAGMGGLNSDVHTIMLFCAFFFVLPLPLVLFFGARTGGKSLEEIE